MGKRTWLRLCACGDAKEVTYRPKKGTKCIVCRGKELAKNMQGKNKKSEGTYIRYWYFCPHCPSVRESTVRLKTSLCGSCSRARKGLRSGKNHYSYGQPRVENKFYRTCPKCPEETATIEVACKKNSGTKPCRKHRGNNVAKPTKTKKGKKVYTPVGFDGRQKVKVKFQIVDEKTMEPPIKKREPKTLVQLDQTDSLRMQEEFLRKKNAR